MTSNKLHSKLSRIFATSLKLSLKCNLLDVINEKYFRFGLAAESICFSAASLPTWINYKFWVLLFRHVRCQIWPCSTVHEQFCVDSACAEVLPASIACLPSFHSTCTIETPQTVDLRRWGLNPTSRSLDLVFWEADPLSTSLHLRSCSQIQCMTLRIRDSTWCGRAFSMV